MCFLSMPTAFKDIKRKVTGNEAMKKKDRGKKVDFIRKANILVIEDEQDVCNLLNDVLTNEGHEVETALMEVKG